MRKTASKTAASIKRITDDMRVHVLSKKNPFKEGTVQADMADVVIHANGKTVGDVKKLKKGLVGSWALRALVERKVIKVEKVAEKKSAAA